MAKIAYILLCHKDPDGIIAQAERLTAAGDCLAIHFDGRSSNADFDRLRKALNGNPSVTFAEHRVCCGWGEWSLVAATMQALSAALSSFSDATHFYMLSGDCMPIKSAAYVRGYLDRADTDHIESFDFFDSDWIKTGIKGERLIYRHFFNERRHKWWFDTSMAVQKRLGMTRKVPADLSIRIGSQWWCLRRSTVMAVMDFVKARPDVVRFFKTTWIPDETFFQTLVRHLVADREIRSRTLTFLMFTDYGMPVTFYNDHYELLLSQDYLFARKISTEAETLKKSLGQLYDSAKMDFAISEQGRHMFRYLTGRGRVGLRFAPRLWEAGANLGREHRLLIIACKKWHVAKRLADRVSQVTGDSAVDYLFDEEATALPDLGGIESSLAKRTRHRRAVVGLIYQALNTEGLIICVDPANLDVIADFQADMADVRLLEIECEFSDTDLIGHAQRVGLVGVTTPDAWLAGLLPTIRNDLRSESEQIRKAGFRRFGRMRQIGTIMENTVALAAFLDISEDEARRIAQTDYLFVD
jgi:hypothetical protein